MARASSFHAVAAIFCMVLVAAVQATAAGGSGFVVIGGQIFTPGLAIVDAPQPYTPLGGDFLQVPLEISGDGKLGLPPYPDGSPTHIRSITMFLTSYVTGLNLTISNGTVGTGGASLGEIMALEGGSSVKHVNWVWPDCLVGDGQPTSGSSSRGSYNISIHQSFLLNSTAYYTIFSLPISITNRIDASFSASPSIYLTSTSRPPCAELENPLIGAADLAASAQFIPPTQYPFTPGIGITVQGPSAGMSGGAVGSVSATVAGSASTVAAGSPSTPGVDSPFTQEAGSPSTQGAGSPSTQGAGIPSTPVLGVAPSQNPYELGGEKPGATTNDPLGHANGLAVPAVWILVGVCMAVGMWL